MTWFDKIPDEYQEHLPGPGPSRKETFRGVAERGLEEGIEPFLAVGQGIKDSLRRIYEVAAQPMGGEVVKPKPFSEAPFEFLASVVGYIASAPVKVIGDLIEKSGTLRKGAARTLLGGPRGELGEWTLEQMEMAKIATELTLGAMVGGGPGAGTGVANIALRSSGKGTKKIVGAYEMLAREYQDIVKPLKKVVELSAGKGPRKKLSQKAVEFIHQTKFAQLTEMKRSYPTATKGLRNIPQEALDLVKEVGLMPLKEVKFAGKFKSKVGRVEYQIGKKLPKETIPHEFLHALQMEKLKATGVKRINPAVLEAHAYEFEGMYLGATKKLPKGEKPTMALFEQIYDESFQAMLKKHGTDFSKYKMREVVSKGHLERKYTRQGELYSQVSPKVGELVESPIGKVKYDGSWEPIGDKPRIYQYTPTEGVAKGMTFATKGQSLTEIAKGALKVAKGRK